MSKYEEHQTVMNEGRHLVAAIIDMGFTPIVHHEPQHLFGYHDDQRPEKAHIVIPRAQIGGASNDVGFLKREDGKYEAIISEYDKRRFSPTWLGKLTQNYATHRAIAIGAQKGYRFLGKQMIEGKVQLRFAAR